MAKAADKTFETSQPEIQASASSLAFMAASINLPFAIASQMTGAMIGLMQGMVAANLRTMGEGITTPSVSPEARKTVEKLKNDALIAAEAARENASVAPELDIAAEIATLEPEDFRRPAEIEKPAQPDDLKQIAGVGPKLEQVLNSLGIFTYAQIAAWSPAEIAWMDDYLQFGGRIGRDGWKEMAAKLARGGKAGQS